MWGLRFLTSYAIGTVVGVLNEYYQKGHQPCYQNPDYSHVLTCGLTNIYGWTLLALTAYLDVMTKVLKLPTILTLGIMLPLPTILELIMGQISKWYFKEQRWKYPPSYYPAFGGTVSLLSGIYFAIGGLIFWFAGYRPLISKI